MVAEGRRLVEDALHADASVVAVLLAADAARGNAAPLVAEMERRGVRAEVVARRSFDALADTATPSGVLAVVEWRPLALDEVRAQAGPGDRGGRRTLVIDGVQDPGNVGTMIRTAFALGAWLTVALEGTADVRSAKVVRSSTGALFRHPVVVATFEEWRGYAATHGFATWVASAAGERADQAGPAPRDLALVVGNEGQGARPGWRDVPHRDVAVPMPGGAESLNAAVAAGILLYEVGRDAR